MKYSALFPMVAITGIVTLASGTTALAQGQLSEAIEITGALRSGIRPKKRTSPVNKTPSGTNRLSRPTVPKMHKPMELWLIARLNRPFGLLTLAAGCSQARNPKVIRGHGRRTVRDHRLVVTKI